MLKTRILSVCLILAMLLSCVPFAAAQSESGWELSCYQTENGTTLLLLPPEDYVRFTQSPRLLLQYWGDQAVQELELSGDAVETLTIDAADTVGGAARPLLRVRVPAEAEMMFFRGCIIPENTAFDQNGNGNAAQTLTGLYDWNSTELTRYDNLTKEEDFLWHSGTVAVGDRLTYRNGTSLPVTICLAGEKVAFLPAGATEAVSIPIEKTGDYELELYCLGEPVSTVSLCVISSQEEYHENLSNALDTLAIVPGMATGFLGVPVVGLFGPLLVPVALVYSMADVFQKLFSFVRIVR